MNFRSPHSVPTAASPPRRREEVVQLEGNAKRAIDTGRTRLLVAGALFAVAYLVIAVRLTVVTLLSDGAEPRLAELPAQVERGEIVDRNGVVLATNLITNSLYANPQQIMDVDEAVARLSELFPDVSPITLRLKLTSGRSFEWLRRNLTPRQQYAVNRLGMPGLYFQREERRVYPQGRLTAHVIGFTDIDNRGLAGIEQAFDDLLRRGRAGRSRCRSTSACSTSCARSWRRRSPSSTPSAAPPWCWTSRPGEILAMVSLPDFDPNAAGAAPDETRFNRNTLGVYEMGSTFKLFTTAMALDSGTSTSPTRLRRRASRSASAASLSPTTTRRSAGSRCPRSSCTRPTSARRRMALEGRPARQRDTSARFGMLKPVPLELPELGEPHAIPATGRINTMTIAFGHGIAVDAAASRRRRRRPSSNGGVYRPATIMKRDGSRSRSSGRRRSSARSRPPRRCAARCAWWSSAAPARTPTCPATVVGGKTGTAEKAAGPAL